MILNKIIDKFKNFYFVFNSIDYIVQSEIRKEKIREQALCSTENGVTNNELCDFPVIVSLTSYGKKIQEVGMAIESLMHQTMKPNKIVLCLAEEFENNLPVIIERQRERGLEVLFCKDVRSYTKLVPTLRKYPQSVIITIDDDIIYPIDFVEYLVKSYNRDPRKVHFYYGHTIIVDSNGVVAPYKEWRSKRAKGCSLNNVPTGVSGVLYPPGCFHEDVCREDIFLELCPYADDLWFKCMTLLNGVECELVERVEEGKRDFVHLDAADKYALSTINNDKNMNDIQFERLVKKYDLLKYLKTNS